jgi:hypothetical protein
MFYFGSSTHEVYTTCQTTISLDMYEMRLNVVEYFFISCYHDFCKESFINTVFIPKFLINCDDSFFFLDAFSFIDIKLQSNRNVLGYILSSYRQDSISQTNTFFIDDIGSLICSNIYQKYSKIFGFSV